MTPHVWLFRLESATIRIIQRDEGSGSEVVVLGSDGLRKQQAFQTPADADRYRAALMDELAASGFRLAWTNTAVEPPPAAET
jgi:hypothetical protein